MGKDPDTIRREIEETRSELGRDLDTLTEKVHPARVVERRVGRAKSAVGGLRERVMGSAAETTSSVSSTVGEARTRVADTASAAPDVVRQRTEGNPLAAGLVAFGIGWLVSSVLPASEKERQAAQAVKEKAQEAAGPVKEELSEVAQEVRGQLQQPVQEAVQSVKETAASAAGTVQEQAKESAQSVKEQAAGSAQTVRDESKGAAQTVREEASGGSGGSGSPEPHVYTSPRVPPA